jgi:hypothetical protein
MEKITHSFKLYSEVFLDSDIPDLDLKKGDVGILLDIFPHPQKGEEEGAVLEFFSAIGEQIRVTTVPLSWIRPLESRHIFSVREWQGSS